MVPVIFGDGGGAHYSGFRFLGQDEVKRWKTRKGGVRGPWFSGADVEK